jgi:CubicO group peptidase (beta-lactamase class C family)
MDFTKVTNYLEALKDIGIPGADLAIYIKGDEVYRHQTGVADIESGTPITPDTIYQFWSMTKVITCVSALRFFEEGIYKLIDPISEYLPEFKDMEVRYVRKNGEVVTEPAKKQIRVVDLFTMSSGLTYNQTPHVEQLGKEKKGNYTLQEFTTAIAKDPLYFEPGTHWHYGYSHDVLGRLIEVLSGKTLGEYFSENIFAPLGMTDTFFRIPKEKEHRMVSCYEYDEESKKHRKYTQPLLRFDLDFKYESPGGGLLSTVDDYAKFAKALSAGGTSKDNYRILSKNTIDLMRANQLSGARMCDYNLNPNRRGYGYGLGVRTLMDKAVNGSNSNEGIFGWSGLAGTYLSIDPTIDMTYVYAQQLIPNKSYRNLNLRGASVSSSTVPMPKYTNVATPMTIAYMKKSSLR